MNRQRWTSLQADALNLLQQLIATPSYSKEEAGTAALIAAFLSGRGIPVQRTGNNVWSLNRYFDPSRPVLLLNSHHDTVRPNAGYTRHPFVPVIEDGKLYGLGSNDAGACLVALIAAFLYYYEEEDMSYNLVLAATAEEEISGSGGVESLLSDPCWLQALAGAAIMGAVVGEPTQMELAVAERGLMVLDVQTKGQAGHAARQEGVNALYAALADIAWFRDFRFERHSELLGDVSMQVTVAETMNKAHNVVPDIFRFVVDVRFNECYSPEELLATIRSHVSGTVTPRSTRLRSTSIAMDHPLVLSGLQLQRSCYGSPTMSDKALMPFPALKVGPGDSARSHTADEFIGLEELNAGMELYVRLLAPVLSVTLKEEL